MAIAKDIPEVYLCEYDTDRESITPYAGQKCIMANGDIYICINAGSWLKLGEEPTPSGFPYTFTIDEFMTLDEITGLLLNRDSKLGLTGGKKYQITIVYNGTDYTAQFEAEGSEQEPPLVGIQLDLEGAVPPAICPRYTSTIGDGAKLDPKTFVGEYGNYSYIALEFQDNSQYQAFQNGVSKIILEEVNA